MHHLRGATTGVRMERWAARPKAVVWGRWISTSASPLPYGNAVRALSRTNMAFFDFPGPRWEHPCPPDHVCQPAPRQASLAAAVVWDVRYNCGASLSGLPVE